MHEASDAYMGYASTDELTTFLNELLEAERAGARVARETARAVGTGPVAEIMRTVQRDKARGCAIVSCTPSFARCCDRMRSTSTAPKHMKARERTTVP